MCHIQCFKAGEDIMLWVQTFSMTVVENAHNESRIRCFKTSQAFAVNTMTPVHLFRLGQ